MKAIDFLIQTRADLQEKSEHWKNEELFVKLQRSYRILQYDLPFFIIKESLIIKKGKDECYLSHIPLENILLKVDGNEYEYCEVENFFTTKDTKRYSFMENKLLITKTTDTQKSVEIVYKFQKVLENINCVIELPLNYFNALRLLFLSDIHEKPTRNTKERNLSTHYLKLYNQEIRSLVLNKKTRPKNVKSKYQIV